MAARDRRRIRNWALLLPALAFSAAIVASNSLPGIWFELTRTRGHTLSAGTRSLLSNLEEPIELHLFLSEQGTRDMASLRRYASRVRALLEEFVLEARGKLVLKVIDPTPSSGAPISLRLVGSNRAGKMDSLAFLPADPRNEALLEHDLARLVYGLAKPGGGSGWRYATLGERAPLIIAHRGASGLFPEHTIPGYLQAIQDGAACIEPDLVMTQDGVLVDRHDIYLSTTTDVASHPEFASRRRKGTDPAYADMDDWYVSDFTLAELKRLRAIQSFPGRSQMFDKLYTVPTFAEVLDVALTNRTVSGAPVCVYPEAKVPAFHSSLGYDIGGEILRLLKEKGLDKPGSPIFIQSFDPAFLKAIAGRTTLPLVLLVANQCDLEAAMKLDGAPFWKVLGVTHQMLFDWRGRPTNVIHDAHIRGIGVHAWTYRDDAPFWGEDVETSMKRALALGLDGFFTDFPFTGYRVVNEMATVTNPHNS